MGATNKWAATSRHRQIEPPTGVPNAADGMTPIDPPSLFFLVPPSSRTKSRPIQSPLNPQGRVAMECPALSSRQPRGLCVSFSPLRRWFHERSKPIKSDRPESRKGQLQRQACVWTPEKSTKEMNRIVPPLVVGRRHANLRGRVTAKDTGVAFICSTRPKNNGEQTVLEQTELPPRTIRSQFNLPRRP